MRRFVLALTLLAQTCGHWEPAFAHNALPEDIWSGRHGGMPAISAYRHDGKTEVSVVLPAELLVNGSLKALTQEFLERWAPEMCSDIFDFQHPHKNMAVTLYVQRLDWQYKFLRFYSVSAQGGHLTIDYTPSRQVTCVVPGLLTS